MSNFKTINSVSLFQCKLYIFVTFLFISATLYSQNKKETDKKEAKVEKPVFIDASTYSGLKFRSIGPAYTSGRIADFAINPNKTSEWYVAVASGNVWKTTNNGQTFSPVFDDYGTYSMGCLAMDPKNPNIVWLGTGENNHQRALGYGNGVYKTLDGGKSWTNMGLKDSRQIGMIAIDPRNPEIVFVAAEGSAWGPGGDRGLYKTTDGGKSWKKVIQISENTGVNNVVIDPDNPDIMYATSEQRRRHVFTKISGGPESAVYKSTDGGENWRKLTSGLPSGHIGGMGIAISPVNTNFIYLIAEAEGESGGFFRSVDKGESWSKMSNHTSSGQYYNEIYCDPVNIDKVYSVETISQFTADGGKTWTSIGNNNRHVDDHAIWIDPKNTDHFIIGGDGGIYESFDAGANYRHISNLPVTQYYRVYVDNDYPFYNVYGGTQDNNSQGGPSRNISSDGVSGGEWVNTVGGDGFWGRVDPTDPNIVYSEYQYGNIYRYDKKSGELLNIQPLPGKGELTFKWNWNTPFIISPHNSKRLYLAANKIFRSDDRGQSWKIISPDLSAGIDRNTWPVMGKFWSIDAVGKDVSTSLFGMVVSLEESPVKEGVIYAGTDDGLIQVTENGGNTWTRYDKFPGVPANTYVSDVFPSSFDENVVFVSFDNILRDDFKPYLFKSSDKGKTWISITGDLPLNGTVHTIAQDFVNPDLLFAGTEFGIFFTLNGGKNWLQLKSGIPTISVRDIAIQKRENDLVLATFGRGIYILDDYTPLRYTGQEINAVEAKIYPIKDALAYNETGDKYGQGSTYYLAKNPGFGAVFTYYLKEVPKSLKDIRKEKEAELFKDSKPIPQPENKQLREEAMQETAYLVFKIYDESGTVIRLLKSAPSKGINRINWDLRYPSIRQVEKGLTRFDPLKESGSGIMVMPGNYSVSMGISVSGKYKELVSPQKFIVKSLNNTTLPAPDIKELVDFQKKVANRVKQVNATLSYAKEQWSKLMGIKQTLSEQPGAPADLLNKINEIEKELDSLIFLFEGPEPKASYEEIPPHQMAINVRIDYLMYTHYSSSSAITSTEKEQLALIEELIPPINEKLKEIGLEKIPKLDKAMDELKAPWTNDRIPDWK
ncbi:MAG: YCF48-related protein [Bacteroidales bacterium]